MKKKNEKPFFKPIMIFKDDIKKCEKKEIKEKIQKL